MTPAAAVAVAAVFLAAAPPPPPPPPGPKRPPFVAILPREPQIETPRRPTSRPVH